ncbi:MAG: DUF2309 domain-containing protein [Thiolinea sp.]
MSQTKRTEDFQGRLEHLLEHLAHVLPAQAPLSDFVHHNTLHGFQHLPFPEALKQARELSGAYGYLSIETFRHYYRTGRISRDDLDAVLLHDKQLDAAAEAFRAGERVFSRGDLYRMSLVADLESISPHQFVWQMEEVRALEKVQPDVHINARETLLSYDSGLSLRNEAETVRGLWNACMQVLQLDDHVLHPEEIMLFSSSTTARQSVNELVEPDICESVDLSAEVKRVARQQIDQVSATVGQKITLRLLLKSLTNTDILDDIRPVLLRQLAAWLDLGISGWPADQVAESGGTSRPGFYAYWKSVAASDHSSRLQDLPDWQEHLDSLPDDPVATLQAEFRRMGIPAQDQMSYLERLALELPGWSGMFLWRDQHQAYAGVKREVGMADYLAVRLVLEHLFARRLCRQQWLIEASLPEIRGRFRRHPAEFMVRYAACRQGLPEHLLAESQQMMARSRPGVYQDADWQQLAELIWRWTHYAADSPSGWLIYNHGWRLFRLAQHLGLRGDAIVKLKPEQLRIIFSCLDQLDDEQAGFIWLQAYERNYREDLFRAIKANHNRGTWAKRGEEAGQPEVQIIFCMDDREEGIRRHLEEINPRIETLGAAAFFNIPMNWCGQDDAQAVKLCPVPVTPVHEVREQIVDAELKKQRERRRGLRLGWMNALHQLPRNTLLANTLTSLLMAPAALMVMLGKSYLPLSFGRQVQALRRNIDLQPLSRVHCSAEAEYAGRSATDNQQGFTHAEQADIVGDFLTNHGLTSGFAPLVMLMGHYSSNQNNPHQAAYGCGACSGRYSGPNARTFAVMANNPVVRELLRERGIDIPADCWVMGAEHDTSTEAVSWSDTDLIPQHLLPAFDKFRAELELAGQHSAHERCRKLASAPKQPSLQTAARHVAARAMDYSQARPELGHATNATAFIGRRFLSQGVFWDRRAFLISYDYAADPDGKILEGILLSAGPVGAGISLEYYFSTVSNDRYGSGSKITHNLAGMFGVMEGASSDLRTGLPRQMIEIHEPMRLLVVLESTIDVVTAIYDRQPVLQELIGNQWLLLAVKNPESADIHLFRPESGFELWEGSGARFMPVMDHSADWYEGHYSHLAPALIDSEKAQLAKSAEVVHA